MTLIASLLHELGGPAFARQAQAGLGDDAVLSLSNGLVLRLSMSSDDEHLLLSSAPLHLAVASDAARPQKPLAAWEASDPELHEASDRVLLDPNSGEFVVQRCVARRVMDLSRLRRELERCVERHAHWRRQLQAHENPSAP